MPVPVGGFIKRLKHVVRFGQWKVLSGNTAVIDGPSVCLLQNYWSDFKRIFFHLCIFVFHQQIQIWLISNDYYSFEYNELGFYAIFSIHRN